MRLTANTHRKARYDYALKKITSRLHDGIASARELMVKGLSCAGTEKERESYSNLLIYRVIFIFFIQNNLLPQGGRDYLERNFRRCMAHGESFYRSFLLPLFFSGSDEFEALSGRLFDEDDIERRHPAIDASNEPFGALLEFFGGYQWRLDEGPLTSERQVNLEVLGYLFEKHPGARTSGAYYTKEATGLYLARNVIVPALAERLESECVARGICLAAIIEGKFRARPFDYFSPALVKGYCERLPKKIHAAVSRVSAGSGLAASASGRFGERGETWRDVLRRRSMVDRAVRELLGEGGGASAEIYAYGKKFRGASGALERMIAHNIDITKLLFDAIFEIDRREVLTGFLRRLCGFRVLDIAAGSGALLFAAMKVLARFYSAVLSRLSAIGCGDAREELERALEATGGSGRDYEFVVCGSGVEYSTDFLILRAVIERNLYGADIMPEAVAAARTRFALALCAKLGEGHPAGAASTAAVNMACGDSLSGECFDEGGAAEAGTARRQANCAAIRRAGGFDAVVCNPPFMPVKRMAAPFPALHALSGASGKKTGFDDAFVLFVLKSLELGAPACRYGFIMPLSATFGVNSAAVRENLGAGRKNWVASFDNIPSPLFAGVSQRICLWIAAPSEEAGEGIYFSTPLWRWRSIYSKKLMERIVYAPVDFSARNAEGARCNKVFRRGRAGLVRVEDRFQLEFVNKIESFEAPASTAARKHFGAGYVRLGYSHVARNFISAYLGDAPPCLVPKTLNVASPARGANVRVKSDIAYAALAAVNSESFYFYWLSRSDGFNVSNSLVSDFIKFTAAASRDVIEPLGRLGFFIHERRYEALRFKKNAGKLVGNFSFREAMPELCRRADLLIFMALGLSFEHYYSVFDHIQRMIALNVNEKKECAAGRSLTARYAPAEYDKAALSGLFAEIDRACSAYFGVKSADIKAICEKYYISVSGRVRPRKSAGGKAAAL